MISNPLPRLHRLVLVLLLSLPLLAPAATPAKAKAKGSTAAAASKASSPPRDCPPTAQDPTPEQVPKLMEAARDRGMLWRLTKDGRTSHLYGTLHVGRLEWLFPGPVTAEAMRHADTMALELDPEDTETLQRLNATLGQLDTARLPPALAQRLARQRAAACVENEAFVQLHPVMQAVVLSILAGRRDGLDPAYSQESVLAALAHGGNLPLVALETPEQQLAAVVPPTPDEQITLIDSTLKTLETGKARPLVVRLSAVWEQGDLGQLERYADWCDCASTPQDREHLRQLVDGRNPNMADRIDALQAQGKTLFVAVGALHMTGPKALPKLLAERGWTVERVEFPR
jgi:uncharacterized protein YbaP (TraB family)